MHVKDFAYFKDYQKQNFKDTIIQTSRFFKLNESYCQVYQTGLAGTIISR